MSSNQTALRHSNSLHIETNPVAPLSNDSNPPAINPTQSRVLQGIIGNRQKANDFFLLLACGKLLAATYVILTSSVTCNQPLLLWVGMMMIYDSMVVTERILRHKKEQRFTMVTTTNSNPSSPNQVGYTMENNTHPTNPEALDEEDARLVTEHSLSTREDDSGSQISPRQQRLLTLIQKYAPWYYVFLFFFGHSVIFAPSSDCPAEAPYLNALAVIFILFQFINVCIPMFVCFAIAFICIYAVCLGVYRLYKSYRLSILSQSLINELPVKKYPTTIAGDPECSICMCNYEEGNEITQLACSKMHHFHTDCIKKWLGLNGICPICRTSLQDMKNKKPQNDREER